ncbi:Acetylglutamate kinase [Buchnera aphidicola (Cinara pseudotaxifoliae)]|uniref:Acetylglutamate kinase n=1 Tax=Buchnera aphidicola (Cinara pseudotaxifoliae) TaxID=655384 RepID=A0A451DG37_9GAMM|nr:hypothetical protein [Buchnera aphidicola]VFP85592.1 Acetylglutamate kinase [Buchnera aphidicola (Cinara pseudotaxifoliae)]
MEGPLVIKVGGILLHSNHAITRLFKELNIYSTSTNSKIILVNGSSGTYGNFGFFDSDLCTHNNDFCLIKKLNTKNFLYSIIPNIVNIRLLAWSKQHSVVGQSVSLPDFFSFLRTLSNEYLVIKKFLNQNKIKIFKYIKVVSFFLDHCIIPFVCSSGLDLKGNFFNINSDVVAMILTIIFNGRLIMLTDVHAVLNGKGQRIPTILCKEIHGLCHAGVVTDGMVIKLQSAMIVSKYLKKSVEIASWHNSNDLLHLLEGRSIGTRIIE